MTRGALAAWVAIGVLGACSSCRDGTTPRDAAPDRGLDAPDPGDADGGAEPPRPDPAPAGDAGCRVPLLPPDQQPPWAADCRLRLTPQEARPRPMEPCGPGRPVLDFPLGQPDETCVYDGWIYAGRGFSRRVRLSDGRVETLTTNRNRDEIGVFWGCGTRGLLLSAQHRTSQSLALVAFRDPSEPGRVVWHHNLRAPRVSGAWGGIGFLRASGAMSFWRFAESDGPLWPYVASPEGENPRRLDVDVAAQMGDFAIDGARLVFMSDWDVMLYDHGTGRLENLTPGPGWQRFPRIEGTRVVYVEYFTRDPLDFDGGNVWLLDLATRQRVAITAQPAAQRLFPAVGGDWVVWEDSRDEADPLPGIDSPATRKLYGYHMRARREVPLVTGVHSASSPLIVGDRLYYACQPSRAGRLGTYVMDLPRVE